jgi:hypothetical protein
MDPTAVKSFFESKAVWGGIIGVAASMAGLAHYSLSAADTASAADAAINIVTAVGSLMAIYGRVVASKKIG